MVITLAKGLLVTGVLCCWVACQPTSPPPSTPLLQGTPLPDPLTFFQQPTLPDRPPDSLTASEIAQLQAGDVLLRRGYGLVSNYILATLKEPYAITHCGLLVPYQGQLGVLHTASDQEHDGVLVESLADYVRHSQAGSLVACRPKSSPAQRQQLLALAQTYQAAAAPFDYSFDDRDSSALYCVELLRDLFLATFEQDYLPLHYQRGELSLLGFHSFFDRRTFTPLFNHCSH